MITSPDNPKVKLARALLERKGREQQGRCLAEGVRLIEDAVRAGLTPALLFYTAQALAQPRASQLIAAVERAGAAVVELGPAAFAALTDTVTSQGVVAVLPLPQHAAPPAPRLALVLDRLRDPGNLGTILRSAEAAGVDLVLLAPGCTDPWSPKVVRAGMGAHFRLPIIAGDWPTLARHIAGRPVWLAEAQAAVAYDRVDWTAPAALVVGGETAGLSAEAGRLATGRVAIPMAGPVDSLNAAMAATVILFEAARQRRAAGSKVEKS
ncbi:MAG: 23S rRNA (uridine(2479)-2'-O)-methyltransferase [Chloroflexi bacterium ADurb.Bin325]|nr:MAG: 23S rRNA (uridine(2479)-2'-O)-methyltransferase [Chloroflexi bacterium ADurb.Bin325]